METILITGGTGLVGNAINSYLQQNSSQLGLHNTSSQYNWIFLSSKDGDLRLESDCDKIFNFYKPTYVIHLAAKVGGLFDNLKHNADFAIDNIKINLNVLQSAHKYNVNKVVSCLSTCIFPDNISYPIDESMLHSGYPHPSNQGYSIAKRLVDTLNRCYKDQHNCNFTSVIPTNIYGPHDNFNLESSHVIPGLINKCYLAKQNKSVFSVSGSGNPLRQFIYSLDLAELLLWVLFNYNEIDPIILSVDEYDEVSIADIANSICFNFNYYNIGYNIDKPDGQYKKTASNSKLRSYLPDYQFTDINDGITKTINWFESNLDNLRI